MAPRKKQTTKKAAQSKRPPAKRAAALRKTAGVRKAATNTRPTASPSRQRTTRSRAAAVRATAAESGSGDHDDDTPEDRVPNEASTETAGDGAASRSGSVNNSTTREGEIAADVFQDSAALATIHTDFDARLSNRRDVEGRSVKGPPQDVTVRVGLKVHTDPATQFQSRLGYHATISLVHSDQGPERTEQIGFIHSWRIDKPNSRTINPDRKARWRTDFLANSPGSIHADGQETALCLQSLFVKAGTVRATSRAYGDALSNDPLIFIQMIKIFKQYQRNRLLGLILKAYNSLLTTLPEWFSFDGSLVLVPGAPQVDDSWGDASPDETEEVLTNAYRTYGDYAIWAKNIQHKKDGQIITVMGRRQVTEQPDES